VDPSSAGMRCVLWYDMVRMVRIRAWSSDEVSGVYGTVTGMQGCVIVGCTVEESLPGINSELEGGAPNLTVGGSVAIV
jgi:hypothetical protein